MGFNDILMYILEYSPVHELFTFGATCRRGRCAVEDVIRNRLVRLLKPYVEGEMWAFEREFTLCAAAISGSTALWMLLIPDNWTPKDLDIIAPSQGADKLVQFFESIGYTSRPTSPDIRQGTNIRRLVGLTKGNRKVMVSESLSDSVFPPLLSASTTLELNAVTMESLVCLYPKLTFVKAGFVCQWGGLSKGDIEWFKRTKMGIYPYSVPWVGNCGYSCPALRRRLHALEGAAVLSWKDPGGRGDVRYMAGKSHYAWTIKAECENPFCEWKGHT